MTRMSERKRREQAEAISMLSPSTVAKARHVVEDFTKERWELFRDDLLSSTEEIAVASSWYHPSMPANEFLAIAYDGMGGIYFIDPRRDDFVVFHLDKGDMPPESTCYALSLDDMWCAFVEEDREGLERIDSWLTDRAALREEASNRSAVQLRSKLAYDCEPMPEEQLRRINRFRTIGDWFGAFFGLLMVTLLAAGMLFFIGVVVTFLWTVGGSLLRRL